MFFVFFTNSGAFGSETLSPQEENVIDKVAEPPAEEVTEFEENEILGTSSVEARACRQLSQIMEATI
jgi:hypothetical protein